MPDSLYDKLKAEIYATNRTENECREYLKHAKDMLFKAGGVDIRYCEEWRQHSGDSDYIVVGRCSEGGNDRNRAYLWELKAPQCFVFVEDKKSKNRLMPSEDLFQAENQLLNYYDELRGNNDFRDFYSISLPSDICIGGLIIGCDITKVRGNFNENEKVSLYHKAFRCRELFYGGAKLRLLLWNDILDHLKI